MLIAARQEEARALWPKLLSEYDTFISALVYDEASAGDSDAARRRLDSISPFAVLDVDDEATSLAEHILKDKAVPEQYPEDAMHIAIAAVNGIEVIVSLNFAHINNPFKRAHIRQSVESQGYICPEICSPDELLETNYE